MKERQFPTENQPHDRSARHDTRTPTPTPTHQNALERTPAAAAPDPAPVGWIGLGEGLEWTEWAGIGAVAAANGLSMAALRG
ncbi:hypothetical protein AB0J81_32785 [Streptomyces bobili]|uniref:hypothetical protein n=1 Tax=Streptomyces bobili TaxID=67280 RepID=UPI00344109A7